MEKYLPKKDFVERIKKVLEDEKDFEKFFEYVKFPPKKSIRVNTIKINVEDLIKKIQKYKWNIEQPFSNNPEIITVDKLEPGELGKTDEHILGYYYIQEITSMIPIIILNPQPNDFLLDLCASPGSKTTQAAALMKNKGTIIANDISIPRIKILSSNLERCGVTNTIITKYNGIDLCKKFKRYNFYFDKILVDAPCSGEGNLRTSPKTFLEWNESLLKKFSKKQKQLISNAFEILKENCCMIYSTCTYSPDENEEVVQYLLDNFKNAKIEEIKNLEIKTRPGITEWKNKKFHKDLKKCIRIYHHDNDTEGFFICKIKKLAYDSKCKK